MIKTNYKENNQNENNNQINLIDSVLIKEVKKPEKYIEKNRKLSILLDEIEKEIDVTEIPNENKILNKVKESKAFYELNTLSAKKGKKPTCKEII